MCIFISAILPKNADLKRVAEVADSFGKDLSPFRNSSIEASLEVGDSLFLTTRGHCDCDSALGSSRRLRKQARDPQEERSRLATKGWSKAKIERSLAQRETKVLKREEDSNSREGKDLDAWLGFLSTVLSSRATPRIGLLTHHYSGNLNTEEVSLLGRQSKQAQDLDRSMLADVEEDVIYMIAVHA